VREVEVGVGAVEYHDVDGVVGFQLGEQAFEVAHHVGSDDVDRRVVEGDSPQRGRLFSQAKVGRGEGVV